jgi:hypothetical protein
MGCDQPNGAFNREEIDDDDGGDDDDDDEQGFGGFLIHQTHQFRGAPFLYQIKSLWGLRPELKTQG